MSWLVPLTLSSNIAQLEFVLRIAESYTDILMANRAWLGPFVEACCVRLGEIDGNPLKAHLSDLANDLGTFLQRALLTQPDVYTYPSLVGAYGGLLRRVFMEQETVAECARQMAQHEGHLRGICRELGRAWEGVERKVDALLFKTLPPREPTPPPPDTDTGTGSEGERNNGSLRLTLADIKLLNRIGPSTHLAELDFFSVPSSSSTSSSAHHTSSTHPTTSPTTPNPHSHPNNQHQRHSAPSPTSPAPPPPFPSTAPQSLAPQSSSSATAHAFRAKLHTLLTWAATSQCGEHKHYAAASLLVRWRERREAELLDEEMELERERERDEEDSACNGGLLSAITVNSPRPELDLGPHPHAHARPATVSNGGSNTPTATYPHPHPLHLQTRLLKSKPPLPRTRTDPPLLLLQRELADWLDTSSIARDRAQHASSVALLYGELVRKGLVSYSGLIRRVIVGGHSHSHSHSQLNGNGNGRGDASASARGESEEMALNREEYARLIPLVDSGHHHPHPSQGAGYRGTGAGAGAGAGSSLRAERIAALYGMSGERGTEEEVEDELKIKLVLALPAFFPGMHTISSFSLV